jgi:sugar-phosphatase
MDVSAVLFDMDGILVDTSEAVAELWIGLAVESGVVLGSAGLAAHVYGCAPEHTVETVFAPLSPQDKARVLERVREAEPDLGCVPIPHAPALVRELAASGVPLALVTGGSQARADRSVRELDLTGCFATTVTWGEAAQGKPAPDCYLLAARRLGVDSTACLVFEDTAGGVRAAVAAGATCVAVNPLERAALLAHGASQSVHGFEEVRFAGLPQPSLFVGSQETYRYALATSPTSASASFS